MLGFISIFVSVLVLISSVIVWSTAKTNDALYRAKHGHHNGIEPDDEWLDFMRRENPTAFGP